MLIAKQANKPRSNCKDPNSNWTTEDIYNKSIPSKEN